MPERSVPTIAVYVSAHGYGHCVRVATVLERLLELRPVRLRVVAPVPERLWPESLARVTVQWRAEATDAGVVERPDLSLDRTRTAEAATRLARDAEHRIELEERWLARGADLVVADVPPFPLAAAARLGLPSVAIANFSWDWIYDRLGLEEAARSAERCYARADLLVEAEPSAPMEAFPERCRCSVITRRSRRERYEVRRRMGLAPEHRLILVASRPGYGNETRLPPPMPDVRYLLAGSNDAASGRSDTISWPRGLSFVDLVAAADLVVSKPGYGIIGDVCGAGTRFLYTVTTDFPEHEVLRRWLARRPATRPVRGDLLASGLWGEEAAELLCAPSPEPDDGAGTRAAAEAIARHLPS